MLPQRFYTYRAVPADQMAELLIAREKHHPDAYEANDAATQAAHELLDRSSWRLVCIDHGVAYLEISDG
jgi:hypothetical protein